MMLPFTFYKWISGQKQMSDLDPGKDYQPQFKLTASNPDIYTDIQTRVTEDMASLSIFNPHSLKTDHLIIDSHNIFEKQFQFFIDM